MEKSAALAESRDRETKFDRQRFAAELAHLLDTPGYTTDKSQLKERGLEEFKMTGKKADTAIVDEADEVAKAFEEGLAAINEALQTTGETFMLGSPETLTVKRNNGVYSKQAHIGSEDFKPHSAYLGKRGKIIYVFKPVMVAEYEFMEMDENAAREKLIGFKEWSKEKLAEVQMKIAETRASQALEKDKAAMAKRADDYAHLGFGEW